MFSPTRNNTTNSTLNSYLTSIGNYVGGNIGSALISAAGSNSFLAPPGPTPYEYFMGQAGNKTISVTIGNALRVTNLIPVNLGWEFENRFVNSGAPICALVTASFMSFTIPTQEEIIAYFLNTASSP